MTSRRESWDDEGEDAGDEDEEDMMALLQPGIEMSP
jgi:hypothetical protein